MKDVTMPKLSDTMTEGTVVAWRKEVGAQVERGEVIAEVETDKATMELEAFASGTLLEIRIDAGMTVPVGTVIGVIGAAGEQPVATAAASLKSAPHPEPGSQAEAPTSPPAMPLRPAVDEILAAPVVRRRAMELGIDLATVSGRGPQGRILLEDLKEVAGKKPPEPARQPPQERPDKAAPEAEPSTAGEPLSRMRVAIARTVSESWRTIPHFSVTVEVRMDAAEQFLHRLQEAGTKVSLTALLTWAAARILEKFPKLNASLQEERLIIHPEINIGIVVRQGEGLLVPVARSCSTLSLAETAQRTTQLVERARSGRLSDTELSGGTFAISNLGMYGVDTFVALILPPMAAVLAAGAVRDAVVAHEGRPAVARTLSLTLSADHRVVDGVYAAEFLQSLRQLLEDPGRLAEA